MHLISPSMLNWRVGAASVSATGEQWGCEIKNIYLSYSSYKEVGYHTYICKTDEIFRQFPNFFIFDIGDYLISLPKESLIAYKDSELSGTILRVNYNFDYDKENEDIWIFGTWYFQEEIATVIKKQLISS